MYMYHTNVHVPYQEYIIYRESIEWPYRSLLHERVFAQSHIPHTPVYLQYHVIKHVATFAGL